MITKQVIIPRTHPCKPAWQMGRLTELLLMGHSWRQVQNMMAISKTEFDRILDAAVDHATAEQKKAEAEFVEQEDAKTAKGVRDSSSNPSWSRASEVVQNAVEWQQRRR